MAAPNQSEGISQPTFGRPEGPARVLRHGWTLVELLIALSLIGIITAWAWPSFVEPVRRAQRAEAVAELQRASLAQERWRATHPLYTADPRPTTGLGLSHQVTADGYLLRSSRYRIELQVPQDRADRAYRVKATAVGTMLGDTACRELILIVEAGAVVLATEPQGNVARCWGTPA